MSMNLDYDLFKKLRVLYPNKWSTIAEGMSKQLVEAGKKPLRGGRIKSWCQEDDREMEEAKHASS